MSEQPFMPFWVGKFVADTMHLSAEETGAYLMLLGAMWMRGGTLLDDREGLCRIARVSPKRWSRVWEILRPFFTFNSDGTFTQKRLAAEYLVASEKRLSKSRNAASGWRKRRASDNCDVTNENNNLDYAPAMQSQCDSNVSHTHTHRSKAKALDKARPSPLSILETVLDTERARAVIEHRAKKRAPLTVRAAELLRGQLLKCRDPAAAADTMILRGWQSVKPEWIERDAGAPQLSRTQQATVEILEEIHNGSFGSGICDEDSKFTLLEFPKSGARCKDIPKAIGNSINRPAEIVTEVFGRSTDGLPCDSEIPDDS